MGFRTVYGRQVSENGWRMCDLDECDSGKVPGTTLALPIRKGDANTVLKGWVSWFNVNVENLNNPGRGYSDEGSFTWTNSVGSSNHLSATAVDVNWSEHNFYVSYSGFTATEIARVRQGLSSFRSCIWWGQDWSSPKDSMHFQLNFPEGDSRTATLARDLRAGYLGIWTPGAIPVTPPPAPSGSGDILRLGSFGPPVAILQTGFNKVFPSYPGLPLAVDSDFGPHTELAVREFQRRVGLDPDGEVGPLTRTRLANYGIKP